MVKKVSGWILNIVGALLALGGLYSIIKGQGDIASNGAMLVIGLIILAVGMKLTRAPAVE